MPVPFLNRSQARRRRFSFTRNPIDQLGLSFPTVAKRPIGNPD
jgi:hypothetical protein